MTIFEPVRTPGVTPGTLHLSQTIPYVVGVLILAVIDKVVGSVMGDVVWSQMPLTRARSAGKIDCPTSFYIRYSQITSLRWVAHDFETYIVASSGLVLPIGSGADYDCPLSIGINSVNKLRAPRVTTSNHHGISVLHSVR